jgi:poly(3-hydroxybutyrate) depolymerase
MPEHEAPRREDSDKSIPWEIQNARLHPSPRRASIYVPDSYAVYKPVPLIIALHGKGQHPSEFEYHTQLSNEETNDRAIVVYPEGINVRNLRSQLFNCAPNTDLTVLASMDWRSRSSIEK